MNFVPCLTWVRKGVAKGTPEKVQLTEDELRKLINETKENYKESLEIENEEECNESCNNQEQNTTTENDEDDFDAKYDLDNYDDEEEEMNPIFNIAGLTLYGSSKDDPYVTIQDEEDEEEKEDFTIKNSDNLLVVGHVEGDSSIMEVYVYNEEEGDLYVHHDVILPAYPLALEWLDFDPADNESGNFIAVGDMTPIISIWDLDVVDALEPEYKLGKKLKKSKKSVKKVADTFSGHTDAVLDLGWNKHTRNILASCSADTNICLWDLSEGKSVMTVDFHRNKVQSLHWHPFETQTLLSGSCDGIVNLCDCRSPREDHKTWTFSGEIEKVLWNHFDPFYFLCSTEDGFVHCVDVRRDDAVFTIKAHNKAVTGLALSSQCSGCLMTASIDKSFKVWDIQNNKPEFIVSREFKLGSLYTAKSCPDLPFTIALGGDYRSMNMKVWDIRESIACATQFGERKLLEPSYSKATMEKEISSIETEQLESTMVTQIGEQHLEAVYSEAMIKKEFSSVKSGQQDCTMDTDIGFEALNLKCEYSEDMAQESLHVKHKKQSKKKKHRF